MSKPSAKTIAKTINISLPSNLVKEIDKLAKQEYASRSDFIRETLVRRIKGQRVIDEWGDEGEWQTVVDFREIERGGVSAEHVLEVLTDLTK
jgi:metal-responsive CopG/Arc/MetJ family transcriptional regulator